MSSFQKWEWRARNGATSWTTPEDEALKRLELRKLIRTLTLVAQIAEVHTVFNIGPNEMFRRTQQ